MNKVPSPTEDLIEELKDPEFKKEYGAEQAKLEFAVVLRNARTQSRLTQQQLAEALGHSQPYIARLEGGEANPTLTAIGRMLAALDLKIVIETTTIKPELETIPVAARVAAGVPDFMLVSASGDVVYVAEMKSLHQRKAEDWISIARLETVTTVSPTSVMASTV